MRKLISLLPILFIFFYSFAFADQLIIEPEMGRAPILNAMQHSKHQLNLVMYGFTDDILLNALIQKHDQGKTVRVILEQTPYKAEDENRKAIQQLKTHDIPWHGTIPPMQLIHQKTMIIDDETAIVMTFNFTKSSFKQERNFGLIIDDPKKVKEIANVFSSDWNHVPTSVTSSQIIYSPDNSREELLSQISRAKKSIIIYAQSVNDFQMVGALAKAAKKGVTIKILTSGKLREKQASYLANAGINVHQSQKLYIHAKVFIIDNQKAILGSINLTKPSIEKNRELSVVTEDPTVIKELLSTFNKDWNGTSGRTFNHHSDPLNKQMLNQFLRIVNRYVKHLMSSH